MPTIYTNDQITANTPANVTLKRVQFTSSSGIRGLLLTNYSVYVVNVGIPGKAETISIPPYTQSKIAIDQNIQFYVEPSSTLSAAAVIPNVPQVVDYQESPDAIEPGMIPLAQLPAYSVNVTGSMSLTGTNNTVNVGNTPSVTISGTPSVNVAGTASVTIANTPTVQLTASGNSVNIANTPSVTISGVPSMNVANTSIPVTNYAGGTLNIAGQVNIGNTPSVSISGTPSVNIASGTVNATIQNASISTQVTNALLQTGSTCVVSKTAGISIAAGGTTNFVITGLAESYYDELSIRVYSQSGQLGYYTFKLDQLRMDVSGGSSYHTPTFPNTFSSTGYSFDSLAFGQVYNPILFDTSYYMNAVNITIKNNYTSLLTDTITVTVAAKYASQNITNSQLPVQATTGSFFTASNFNVGVSGSNVPFLASGGYITQLKLTIVVNAAQYSVFQVQHGGVAIDTISVQGTFTSGNTTTVVYNFADGVANNGFSGTFISGTTGFFQGYGVTTTKSVGKQQTTSTV